jgi:hypothetical protein
MNEEKYQIGDMLIQWNRINKVNTSTWQLPHRSVHKQRDKGENGRMDGWMDTGKLIHNVKEGETTRRITPNVTKPSIDRRPNKRRSDPIRATSGRDGNDAATHRSK